MAFPKEIPPGFLTPLYIIGLVLFSFSSGVAFCVRFIPSVDDSFQFSYVLKILTGWPTYLILAGYSLMIFDVLFGLYVGRFTGYIVSDVNFQGLLFFLLCISVFLGWILYMDILSSSEHSKKLNEKRWIVARSSSLYVEHVRSPEKFYAAFWRPYQSNRLRACLQFQNDQFCLGEVESEGAQTSEIVMPMRCTDGRLVEAKVEQIARREFDGQMAVTRARFHFNDGVVMAGKFGLMGHQIRPTTPPCFKDEWRAETLAR
ncbi:MAG: hypothetical protein KTR21_07085 [Rhodobacteraceae bacterium]|nr:hypothetical protein [Paracoccaceae bacterium]